MSSHDLQASSALTTIPWHRMHWAAGHRWVRSLQRRIVQARPAGAGRQAKRLSSVLGHSVAARFRRHTSARAGRQEDARQGRCTLGHPREESRRQRTPGARAQRRLRASPTLIYPQAKRHPPPARHAGQGRPRAPSPGAAGVGAAGCDPRRPHCLGVSAPAPRCGGHRPGRQGPATADVRALARGGG